MATMTVTRNFADELKHAQAAVKNLAATREKLVGDARVEAHNVKQALETLTSLGVENADKLTLEELAKLRATTQADLEKNLDELKVLIAEGESLMNEYKAATV